MRNWCSQNHIICANVSEESCWEERQIVKGKRHGGLTRKSRLTTTEQQAAKNYFHSARTRRVKQHIFNFRNKFVGKCEAYKT
jgi:hypothetical protein